MGLITGTTKYEKIQGTYENDTIDGLGGSDLMKDYGDSDDSYIFNYGYGQPTIEDRGGNDTIIFGEGITADDLTFYKSSSGNLFIRIKDTIDKLELKYWFTDDRFEIETLVFQDGTTLTSDQINALVDEDYRVLVETTGDDTLKVGQGNNLIYLMGGNDTFISTGGNNIVELATGDDSLYNKGTGNDETYCSIGNDYIEDWGGDDRYIYDKGDGTDIIIDKAGEDVLKFGLSISKSDLTFSQVNDNLVIKFSSYEGSITIENWFSDTDNQIETLEFWDGSTYTSSQINSKILGTSSLTPTITGTDNYDYSGGNYGDDIYYLKKGNDKVMDYAGDDTYLFNTGDGQDTIKDQAGDDCITFGEGITKSDLSVEQSGNNLIIKINGTTDKITITDWYREVSYADYKIETINFADGSCLTADDLETLASGGTLPDTGSSSSTTVTPTIVGTDDYDYSGGNYGDDIYYLKKGNDKIMDYAGNDTYMFNTGDGQDTVTDQAGDDCILFGAGITHDDLSFSKVDNYLYISINNSSDVIKINNWFKSSAYEIESIKFTDDSTVITHDYIDSLFS